MSEHPLEPLGYICEINPDTLTELSEPTIRYRYIDLSSIKGQRADLSITPLPFADLPSRARRKVAFHDVLLGTVRPNLKNFAIIESKDDDLLCSTGFAVLRSKTNTSDPHFIFHAINSEIVARQLNALVTGSNYPAVNATQVAELLIPVPPLPEQKKIAEILSGIDHSLAKLGDKINALTRLRVQLTRQFLTHEDHPKTNHEGVLPLDWQVKTLDEVAQFRRGSFPQPYGNPEWFDENGFPFVQVFDIDDNGKLKSSTKSRISKAGAERSIFIPCGSLIVSLQGSIGRVAITQYDAYVDRTILIFTDYQKDLDREYFSLLIGDLFSRQGEVADGGVIKTITKQTLKDFSIKIPPLNEQKRMSKVVFALDRHISLYKKKLLKGNFLKQSLMGDLLSGRKRVSV